MHIQLNSRQFDTSDVQDYTHGVRLDDYDEEDYVRMKDGEPAPTFLLPVSAPLEKLEHKPSQVANQTKQRQKWERQIEAERIAKLRLQRLVPLRRSS